MEHIETNLLEGLAQISKGVMERNYLEDILALIVSVTADVTGSKICSILLLDKKKDALVLKACQSDKGTYSQREDTPMGRGIAGRVAESNKVVMARNVTKDPRFINKRIAKQDGLVSLLSVPMSVENEVIGVINCYTAEEYEFPGSTVQMITAVAAQAAIIIKNTRLRVMKQIVEKELKDRKIIDQAKEIIMSKREVSGSEAYSMMRKQSMNTRKSMAEIAESILVASSLESL